MGSQQAFNRALYLTAEESPRNSDQKQILSDDHHSRRHSRARERSDKGRSLASMRSATFVHPVHHALGA
ncbi:MAG: hypothetical protein BMS9Abin26_1279 [Gammaproteobacteria bacterium]|nr:MAG: hypothetical protein BMS9Abin26_1279 [Gammaproteobacteria bacterium]